MLLRASDVKILYPKLKEADPNNIVPTTSTSFVMMLCDCLATTIMEKRKFTKENFFLYHKGGNLGSSLRLAKDIMVTGEKMPVVDYKKNFTQALKVMNKKKLGIVVITKNRFIKGLITDGDIRRVLNNTKGEKKIDKITRNYPLVINENMPASKALGFMSEKKITSLLVVSDKDKDKKNKILRGIIHIHFLLKDGIK
jgi:arabinose-5-phosphate isomerase